MDKKPNTSQDNEVRKGPWTMEEDLILINYIANHGEGVWNSLARSAGLKRTGKSCRLRWLNYLRPDVRRGNISPEEELLIMELHAKWGNRWSKIAKHLPGRTDNEIKNYWRTRIQKHLKRGEQMMMSNSSNCSPMNLTDDQQATSSSQITTSSYGGAANETTDDHGGGHPYFPTMSPASSSYPTNHHQGLQLEATNYIINNNPPPHLHHHHHPDTCNENFWGTADEDLWSMQLFNGD